jgi:hypothetical protein
MIERKISSCFVKKTFASAEGHKSVFSAREQKTSEITIPVVITVFTGEGYRAPRV